jgi:hypothetical protein
MFKDGESIDSATYPTGAFAIASHLRHLGFDVLVIPYFSRLTFSGMKKIVNNNSKNLLWVGISTTLFNANADFEMFDIYRDDWANSSNELIDVEKLVTNYKRKYFNVSRQMPTGTIELNAISKYLKDRFNVPLLIGGSWVSTYENGNLGILDSNIHIISGRSETKIEEITFNLQKTKIFKNSLASNDTYDNTEFKNRSYHWSKLDLIEPDEWLPLEISRGCAFNCAYCSFDRKSTFDSYRNPEALRQELINNYEMFGVTKYILMDDLYNDSKNKVRILYDKVWSKLPFTPEWTSYMRLDMFWNDPESAEFILNSGAKVGTLGIETLHDIAGRKVGKGLGKTRILETLDFLKEKFQDDVLLTANFLMGLPDEPVESMMSTIEWLKTNKVLFSYNVIPLWITPPSHRIFVLKTDKISKDNDQYGVTWESDLNWKNQQGVTFEQAQQLANLGNKNENRISVGFSEYPELRTMGLTHKDIAGIKTMSNIDVFLKNRHITKDKIYNKLNKFLNYKDI